MARRCLSRWRLRSSADAAEDQDGTAGTGSGGGPWSDVRTVGADQAERWRGAVCRGGDCDLLLMLQKTRTGRRGLALAAALGVMSGLSALTRLNDGAALFVAVAIAIVC